MAPLPAETQAQTIDENSTKQGGQPWTTATIVVGAVFLFFALAFIGTVIAFYFHKRKLHKKLPAEHRTKSYHPFRTETSDKSSLLADAHTSDEERSSMFSRERSSVSVYVDTEPANRRVSSQSMETVSLIPLHVAQPERHESLTGEISNGSGVSGSSSRYSRGSMSLSPIQQEDGDLGSRSSRPRSTSTSSVRYYGKKEGEPDSTTWKTSNAPHTGMAQPPQLPEIPRIVHTLSD
jgi:LysM repeat protein